MASEIDKYMQPATYHKQVTLKRGFLFFLSQDKIFNFFFSVSNSFLQGTLRNRSWEAFILIISKH